MKLSGFTVTVQSLANNNVNGAIYIALSDNGSVMAPVSSLPTM